MTDPDATTPGAEPDTTVTRAWPITPDLVRAYSRRGNYHSDADEARSLGLPGLLVQGTHVAGPAYSVLLDRWGEDFLRGGEIDVKFVGLVTAGETVVASVNFDDSGADIEVGANGRVAVVGRAWRRAR